jgi:hypothetical protein
MLTTPEVIAATIAGLESFGLRDIVFAAGRGADQNPTGHGEFAEKATVWLDRIKGEKAQHVGANNAKNGPDKIVDNRPVQCKYCKTGTKSVEACFATNKTTGQKEFRYRTLDGKPMMVEVPKDQYEKAVAAMKDRIRKGEVPGVTDPDKAYEIIRKGKITYQQARNLAKAGTFESLAYDAVTGAINCSFAFGVTALVTFGIAYMASKDPKKAAKASAQAGLQTFGLSLAMQILSTQTARTALPRLMAPATDIIVKQLGNKATQTLINALRTIMGKAPIYGAAAAKSLAKALRSNIVVAGITVVVSSVPETYKIARGQMSSGQYFENLAKLLASIAGAAAGPIGAGIIAAKIAAAAGVVIVPGTGAVAGFVGGFVGGLFASMAADKVIKLFREDDLTVVIRIFNAGVMNAIHNYMLTESEMNEFLEQLTKDEDGRFKKLLKDFYGSKTQYRDVEHYCESIIIPIIQKRSHIGNELLPNDDEYTDYLTEVIEEVAESA